ncbi:RNA-binding, CRM domain-containing protein [Artemisia annua]|uniref:RNA-binding, CRM domain-containing protein n=1 Tax=Artemisia annua TaxID=35608 RepID=A0A2U1L860_ARTAN|nr:RNA-binding, CRM domain-containing protein [Artemisia annua]
MGALSSSSPLILRCVLRRPPSLTTTAHISSFFKLYNSSSHQTLLHFHISHHPLRCLCSITSTPTIIIPQETETEEESNPNDVRIANAHKEMMSKLREMSVKEKKELGSYANSLGKKLKSQQVGKSGVTHSVALALLETLEANELLKPKVAVFIAWMKWGECKAEDNLPHHLIEPENLGSLRMFIVFAIGLTRIWCMMDGKGERNDSEELLRSVVARLKSLQGKNATMDGVPIKPAQAVGSLSDGFQVVVNERPSGKSGNAKGGVKAGQNVRSNFQCRSKVASNTSKATVSSKGGKEAVNSNNSKSGKETLVTSSKNVVNTYNKYDLLLIEFDNVFEECKLDDNDKKDGNGTGTSKEHVDLDIDDDDEILNIYDETIDFIASSSMGNVQTMGQALPLGLFLMFSLASWNIRGLNRSPKQKEVSQVVNENNFSVCPILEFHMDVSVVYDMCKKRYQLLCCKRYVQTHRYFFLVYFFFNPQQVALSGDLSSILSMLSRWSSQTNANFHHQRKKVDSKAIVVPWTISRSQALAARPEIGIPVLFTNPKYPNSQTLE